MNKEEIENNRILKQLAEAFADISKKMFEIFKPVVNELWKISKKMVNTKLTKKKFIKLLQSQGIQRNKINEIVKNNKEPYTYLRILNQIDNQR